MLINDQDLKIAVDYLKKHAYMQDIENVPDFLKEGIKNLTDQKHDFQTGKSIKNSTKALLAMIHSDRSLDSYSGSLESLAKILTPMLRIEPAKMKSKDEIETLQEAVKNLEKIRMALAGTYRYNAPSHHQTTNQQHARKESHSHTQYSTDYTSTSHQQRDDYYKHMQEEIRRKLDEQLRKEQEEFKRMRRQQKETQTNQERTKRQQHESYQEMHRNHDTRKHEEDANPFKKTKTENNYYGSNRGFYGQQPLSWAEILRQQREDLAAGNQSYEQYRQKNQKEENQSTRNQKSTQYSTKQEEKHPIHQEIEILFDKIKNATLNLEEEYLKMQQAYNDMKESSDSKKFAELVNSYRKISGESGIYWKLHKEIDPLSATIKVHLENQIKEFEKIYEKIYDKATILRDHDAPNLRDLIDRSKPNSWSSRRN